jgi:PhnB protein
MTQTAGHVPSDYHSVTPYLILDGAGEAITFYERAFGARQLLRLADSDGKVRYAEIQIGDSPIMLVDASLHNSHPQTEQSSPPHLYLYVENADSVVEQAVAAGARLFMRVEDQGDDRRGGIVDPFDQVWYIGTRLNDETREQIQTRFDSQAHQESR